MLGNNITLKHDLAGTPVDVLYSRYEEYKDRTVYIADDHTLEKKHTLSLYRQQPKRVGNNRGAAKPALKVFREAEIVGADQTTTLILPQVGDVSFSLPVGSTDAQIQEIIDELISALQDTDLSQKLIRKLEI